MTAPIDRLDCSPVTKRLVNEEYDPELALLAKKWMGEVLSSREDLTLECYLFSAGTHYSNRA
jgi:hypothetical protein